MTDLYHLAYVSDVMLETSDQEPAQAHLDGQLREILDTAKRNNRETDVTGALLFSGSHFAQVLEGSESAINDRFRAISQDTRHHNVTPLLYEPAGERQVYRLVNGAVHARGSRIAPRPGKIQALTRKRRGQRPG